MERFVIIVAGGSGERMGGETPKQFLLLDNKPLLMYALEAFYRFSDKIQIVLVLPAAQRNRWNELCKEYNFTIPHQVVAGGNTRSHSVQNGLNAINIREAVVAVHDGVRPFPGIETIRQGFQLAENGLNAVPAIAVNDSLRVVSGKGNQPLDRSTVRKVQTPQVFPLNILKKAYSTTDSLQFTDDAQLVEKAGYSITLFDGNPENIKITTPTDLRIAGALITEMKNNTSE